MKRTKKLFMVALVFAFAFSCATIMNTTTAEAAKKPKLNMTKYTTILGEAWPDEYWDSGYLYYDTKKKQEAFQQNQILQVKNKVKGASYSFKSSNTKIVKVDKYGLLTGVKAGTAKITCTQTLKGKKTTVGTCTVTVKAPVLAKSDTTYDSGVIGKNQYFSPTYNIYYCPCNFYKLEYFTMKYESKEDGLSFSQIKDEEGQWLYTATKAGTYHVTVSTKYNKKWYKLGTFEFIVNEVGVKDDTFTMYSSDSNWYDLQYVLTNTAYPFDASDFVFEVGNDGVLGQQRDAESYDDGCYREIEVLKEGVTTIKVSRKDGTNIGTATLTVEKYVYDDEE